jgi:hypothetical protein
MPGAMVPEAQNRYSVHISCTNGDAPCCGSASIAVLYGKARGNSSWKVFLSCLLVISPHFGLLQTKVLIVKSHTSKIQKFFYWSVNGAAASIYAMHLPFVHCLVQSKILLVKPMLMGEIPISPRPKFQSPSVCLWSPTLAKVRDPSKHSLEPGAEGI